ncbi:MAG: AzlD domain-containing protein [Proteobacteria bacterium]|nr:AzlD domain-containing protein [Pseudomonadota bacterium]
MTFTDLGPVTALTALFVVLCIGWLPTELWRMLAVLAARGLDENSEILVWVRLVASALLAAVVAKIILAPTGAIAAIPLWGRIGGVLLGLLTLRYTRKSIVVAVLTGETVLLLAGTFGR